MLVSQRKGHPSISHRLAWKRSSRESIAQSHNCVEKDCFQGQLVTRQVIRCCIIFSEINLFLLEKK